MRDSINNDVDELFRQTAREANVQIVAGVLHVTAKNAFNEARLIPNPARPLWSENLGYARRFPPHDAMTPTFFNPAEGLHQWGNGLVDVRKQFVFNASVDQWRPRGGSLL